MNPFGTYYGNQRHHFSRGNDEILNTYTLVAAQGKSIAPSYNGSSETAMFGLYPMNENGSKGQRRSFLLFLLPPEYYQRNRP